MPQRRKTAARRKRALRTKKKATKSRTTKKVSTAKSKAATRRGRMAASARKKVTPRASKKRVAKSKARRKFPTKAPTSGRDNVEVVERLVVDTVEEVAPGVLVVSEYEIEGGAAVSPAKGRNKTVEEPQ